MAFWYTRERMKYGPVFGNKDLFEGLAVIIDTYSNHNGEHNVHSLLITCKIFHCDFNFSV